MQADLIIRVTQRPSFYALLSKSWSGGRVRPQFQKGREAPLSGLGPPGAKRARANAAFGPCGAVWRTMGPDETTGAHVHDEDPRAHRQGLERGFVNT